MNRPLSLILVAGLFCLLGATAVWEMFSHYSPGHVFINPLALLLVVGIGLIRLRPFWRLFALICVILLFLLVLATAVLRFLGKAGAVGLPVSVSGTWVGLGLFALVLGWMVYVLDRRDIRALFSQRDA